MARIEKIKGLSSITIDGITAVPHFGGGSCKMCAFKDKPCTFRRPGKESFNLCNIFSNCAYFELINYNKDYE